MKQVAQIAIGVLVAGMLLWWMIDPDGFRHNLWGYSQKEIDRSQLEFETAVAHTLGPTKDATITYGDADTAAYQACHDGTPKTKKQKRDCVRLEKKVAAH